MSAPGGWGCLLWGVSAPRGVSAPGGLSTLGGCLLPGGCLLRGGVCSRGVSAPRGLSAPGGCSPACTEADTTPPVNRITHACENITLPQLRCGR